MLPSCKRFNGGFKELIGIGNQPGGPIDGKVFTAAMLNQQVFKKIGDFK